MVAGWHVDREYNSMTERIKPVELRDRRIFSPERGLSRQVLAYSNQLMLVRHLMEKGWIGSRHSHPQEQLVYIVRGHIHFQGGAATFDARTGDSFVVPGGMEHQANAVEESEVLDIFTPVREDYVESR
jgi:quercetin dioxygenase-like cupin family protein